jgi:thymidylate kinase
MIQVLQKLAAQVLELKKTHRQKRPIVIEFSGSPKSGKTSCINSLELFLKRNNFSVEIIHERAGICRVANKHSPMFNLWTSCTSIAGMIDVLEREDISCDVLILDRSIFDACCWFNWLTEKKYMEIEQKNIIEKFLTMDDFVDRIDIVFVFCVRPEISIEREYANLLTDKEGSIMNSRVLSEYLKQIEKTIKEKKNYFHKIFKIDTSKRDQDEVGKEVTERTLNTLKELLMERIGFFTWMPI